ncbi:Monodehydroascorbate reductase family protein [Rhynchospora pubera]|uniref:monodehydroascorbate reductase (NADH) n=1 Tax=Rhynchospora pubera TaxID=906938 RepID=A0AAV8EW33_9POAL|nr:Monodehydroascorbate reductase family protein [Rhynchospora pubera]
MGRAFVYVILGGGVAAGYAALEFSRRHVAPGELCIISEESVAPYERPALSKGYLLPENPTSLPQFHTCVGANEERLTPKWYGEKGIELILGTRVKSADLKKKALVTMAGETITYKYLIIATGARALKLEEFGVWGSEAENVCYLRDIADADRMVKVMQSCAGKSAVVIGGGYIGMECTAALVTNKIKVTMVFPEKHLMGRLFTAKMAEFYENYYKERGVKFVKGNVLTSFENDPSGKVTAVILRDGTRIPTDMVVVGIGIRANTSLFDGLDKGGAKLALEKGGIKVNGKMQTSDSSVYAVGDVAAFPVKLFGNDIRRLEHVDSARKTARHAVSAIMAPDETGDLDYLPFFYSRVFALSWQFYGDNVGEVVHFGDFLNSRFGAYWVNEGHIIGAFLEGGAKEDYEAIAKVVKTRSKVSDVGELEKLGLEFAFRESQKLIESTVTGSGTFSGVGTGMGALMEKPLYKWHATAGVVAAASIAVFAYWYGWKRRRW